MLIKFLVEKLKSNHLIRNLVWFRYYIRKNPAVINLDVANGCNLRCSFCVTQSAELEKKVMKLDVAKRIIDSISAEFGSVFRIYFQKDGEPLLNKKIADIINYANLKEIAHYYSLITNGVLLTKEVFIQIVEAGITDITVSIDAINREDYFRNKAVDNYDVVVSNLKCIAELMGKVEYKNRVTVRVKSVAFNKIHSEIFLSQWSGLGFTVDIHKLHNWAGESNFKTSESHDKSNQRAKICSLPFHTLVINSDTTVSTCCVDGKRISLHGSVLNGKLHDSWHSVSMKGIRKGLAEGSPISICTKCDYWKTRESIPRILAKKFYE